MFHFWSSSSAQPTATVQKGFTPVLVYGSKAGTQTGNVSTCFIGRTRRVGSMMSHQENKGKRSGGGRRREAIMGRRKGRAAAPRERPSILEDHERRRHSARHYNRIWLCTIGLFYPAAVVPGRKRFLCGRCVGAELMRAANRILFFPTYGRGLCDWQVEVTQASVASSLVWRCCTLCFFTPVSPKTKMAWPKIQTSAADVTVAYQSAAVSLTAGGRTPRG